MNFAIQELSTKRVARESNSEVAVFDMDVIPEESAEGERSKKSSREERREENEHQDEGHYKIAEKLLSSRATQNWFFQNTQSAAADGAAVAEAADAAARKAKEFHMWSPQTM